MFHVMQYDETGQIVEIGVYGSLNEARDRMHRAEREWDRDLYGACFIVHRGVVVGGSASEADPVYEAGYAYACGYRD